ncbi:hypothetical protein QTP86_025133 [Hemibagrus guttatus]|nr:hypothetical protein QTP86_025133 [Hemibagrus guttatus]
MFREAAINGDSINLEEYTTSVTSYIGKCIEYMTVSKTITTRSNQKPDASVPDALNDFYARFEAQNNVAARKTIPPPNDQCPNFFGIGFVRMLFLDFSSAFNTIIPQHLIEKLSLLGLNTSLCNWILDFLTGRPQSVRIGNSLSSTTTLSTGAPQGCVLSPLLFTLLTHDCAAMHSSNHIMKFADDMTIICLISVTSQHTDRRCND